MEPSKFYIFFFLLDTTPQQQLEVCFIRNVNSPGHDIGLRTGISSANECQQICNSNSNCKYFVYGDTAFPNNCVLKSERVTHLAQYNGIIFGPKICRKTKIVFQIYSINLLIKILFNTLKYNPLCFST